MSEQIITVEILEDGDPEPDEVFEIILASPKHGLAIGDQGKGSVLFMRFIADIYIYVCSIFCANIQGPQVLKIRGPDGVFLGTAVGSVWLGH